MFIPGRPYTKKNSGRYVGKGRFLPSKAYSEYERAVVPIMRKWAKEWRLEKPIDYPIEVTAVYTMLNRVGWPDLVGLLQATGDLLEAAGIIENDRLIVSWGNSHIHAVNKEKAGVGISIREWVDVNWFDPRELDPWLMKRTGGK